LSKKDQLPKTWTEICSTNAPHIKYKHQVIATEYWPDKDCKCKGLGYVGLVAQEPIKAPKLGINRNKLCPCGSGKKFKHCCLKRIEEYKRSKSSLLLCHCIGVAKSIDESVNHELLNKVKEVLNLQKEK
jgi:hypothetical protein